MNLRFINAVHEVVVFCIRFTNEMIICNNRIVTVKHYSLHKNSLPEGEDKKARIVIDCGLLLAAFRRVPAWYCPDGKGPFSPETIASILVSAV